MHDRTHQGNGTAPSSTVQPEIVEPSTGNAYPMPRNHGVPPGCVVVRKEFAYALGGVAVGAVLMWLVVRELKGR
jgi:hypothetical protein